jgi:predicted acyltransferase
VSERRILALDAFRGFAIAGMLLVNNPGDDDHVYGPLDHAAWNGWTFTDTIFPFFLFACGVAMPMSIAAARARGLDDTALVCRFLIRAATLFGIGLALNFIPAFDPSTLRIPGVLQRIALCIAIATPVIVGAGARPGKTVFTVAALLFLVYAAVQFGLPVPGPDGAIAAGRLEPGRDAGAWLDRALLEGHLWAHSRTWDPEGLLSTLPAACSLLGGALAGLRLRGAGPAARIERDFVAWGVASLAAGWALDALGLPINKNLWTPSYCLLMNGLALLILAGLHRLLDGASSARAQAAAEGWLRPLTIFGMNALLLFVVSGLVGRLLYAVHIGGPGGGRVSLKSWLFAPIAALPLDPRAASLVFAILFDAAMFALAWLMWRRRWFLRA